MLLNPLRIAVCVLTGMMIVMDLISIHAKLIFLWCNHTAMWPVSRDQGQYLPIISLINNEFESVELKRYDVSCLITEILN